ncbi:hypothetical protein [Spirosoma utsteinense]|uniref:Uncharacterized protein n=1 Tax=Spirosoma utsteinense TaxID=2585773 RepID=A0ABR6W171_9BACT|nr:hypothetical protein [Spirosoma utsteinense]MBC3786507.1 putative protein (UPF0216 family) [Spirosoma utsteinense]MBC3789883.1 putative protein (UPF0216 family) [Spirosoma utsteinense]
MEATYHLNPDELNENFLKAIQVLFQDRRLKVTVEIEDDETEAIRSNGALHEKLIRRMANADAGSVKEVNLNQYLSDASTDV